jgi:hypothetical protein
MFGRRTLRHESGLDGDFDLTGDGAVHSAIITKTPRGTNYRVDRFGIAVSTQFGFNRAQP